MSNIAIAPRFFKTERQSYTHWIRAWVREAAQNSIDAGAHSQIELNSTEILLNSMILVNESEDEKVAQIAKTYSPEYWERYKQGGDKIKLLKMWMEAIAVSLEHAPFESLDWSVGFVFSSKEDDHGKVLAQCREESGVYYFLINPLTDEGKMAFSLNNKADHFKLLSRASHEVTHVYEKSHNQAFAYCRDSIFESVLSDSNEAIRRLKVAKDS